MQTPFRLNDLLLVVVVITSMLAAIIFPDFGSLFQALPVYCLMANFFLSYLSIELADVWKELQGHSRQISAFTVMKLAVLPVVIYFVFYFAFPAYALSALLLTGVSTGVVAPMISNMVKGNSSLVLVGVVITSVLSPFTLPALIKIIAAKEVAISFLAMLRMLAMVVFIPIIAVEVLRRLIPRLIAPIMKIQFPLSLLFFCADQSGRFLPLCAILQERTQCDYPRDHRYLCTCGYLLYRRHILFSEKFAGESTGGRGHAG